MEHMETLPDSKPTTPSPLNSSSSHSTPQQPALRNTINPYQKNPNYHSKTRLHQWLQDARKPPNPSKPKATPPILPNPIQTTINPSTENKHWGGVLTAEPSPDVLRIVLKNVNSLNTDDDFVNWKAAKLMPSPTSRPTLSACKKPTYAGNLTSICE